VTFYEETKKCGKETTEYRNSAGVTTSLQNNSSCTTMFIALNQACFQRQENTGHCASAMQIADGNFSIMIGHNFSAYRQAKTTAVCLVADIGFKGLFKHISREPGASVANQELQP